MRSPGHPRRRAIGRLRVLLAGDPSGRLGRYSLGRRRTLEDYHRFRITDSGVSPISQPGMEGGNYLASGIEHTETGAPTASGEAHARMNKKRINKLDPLKRREDLFIIEGDTCLDPRNLRTLGEEASQLDRGLRHRWDILIAVG